MLLVLRVGLFTLGVCLVVGVSALLIRATLLLTGPHLSTRASSLLALLVFLVYVSVPTYLLATRTEIDGDGRVFEPEDGHDSGGAERSTTGTGAETETGTGTDAGTGTSVTPDEPTAPDEPAATDPGGDSGVADRPEGDPADERYDNETGAA